MRPRRSRYNLAPLQSSIFSTSKLARLLQRAVGPEGFVGEGLDGVKAAGKQLLDLGLVRVFGEEPLAFANSPYFGELVFADVDSGCVGVAGAPEQGGAFTMLAALLGDDEGQSISEKLVRVENDGRARGLVA